MINRTPGSSSTAQLAPLDAEKRGKILWNPYLRGRAGRAAVQAMLAQASSD
jgi:hypothetical protein